MYTILVCCTSCSYTIVHQIDEQGNSYNQRYYSSSYKQQRYLDRQFIKNFYTKEYYPKATQLIRINDTTVHSDSLTFYTTRENEKYFGILFNGILSGNTFKKMRGNDSTSGTFYIENDELKCKGCERIYTYYFYDIIKLAHIKSDKHHMFFKLKVIPKGAVDISCYIIEIENMAQGKYSSSFHNFLEGAKISSFLYYGEQL